MNTGCQKYLYILQLGHVVACDRDLEEHETWKVCSIHNDDIDLDGANAKLCSLSWVALPFHCLCLFCHYRLVSFFAGRLSKQSCLTYASSD